MHAHKKNKPKTKTKTDYHSILPNLIVGTQPTSQADIDRLHDVEGVTCMFDTQQDKDKEHWGVDAGAIKYQMDQRGVEHWRHPFVDFNADSLRQGLPHAVAAMDKAIRNGHVVYCHCTAGMGRSPGVAIAYLYWCHQFEAGMPEVPPHTHKKVVSPAVFYPTTHCFERCLSPTNARRHTARATVQSTCTPRL